MTDRPHEGSPYEGYEGYEGYAQQYPQPQPQSQPQAWPGQQQRYDDPHAVQQQRYDDPHAVQQWQGQTWETQPHAPVTSAEQQAAYLSPQGYQTPGYHEPSAGGWAVAGGADIGDPALGRPAGHAGNAGAPGDARAHGTFGASGAAGAHGVGATGLAGTAGAHGGQGTAGIPGHAGAAGATPEGGAQEPPAYGPATMSGNARVTDAQRARAEGRSPVIEPGMQPAALTALLGLLLAGAAEIGTYALLVPLVVLQAVTAAGWFRLNGMWPARQGIALGFAGALVADVVVLAAGREHAPAAILGTLGVWVLLSLVLQLRSHADPDERMYGLMATVASAALSITATGHLAAGADAVAVGAGAVAVAVLARALPLPTAASVVVSLLAAAGAGIAVGGATDVGARGALLGAAAGACALIGHRVASYDYPSRFVHFTAGVALPLTAAAPAVWVLGRALG